jgi:predicted helicase
VPHDADLEAEWRQFAGLADVFPRNSAGIITARDALVIGLDKEDLAHRLKRFSTSALEDAAIYDEFGFSPSKRFDLRAAQAALSELDSFDDPIRPILHRPFDERFLFFHPSVVWSLSRPMADQMVGGDNLALVATRQVTRPQFEHAFVSRHMIEIKACSHDRNTQIFPLYTSEASDGLLAATPGASNLDRAFLKRLAGELGLKLRADARDLGSDAELTPRRVFDYVYAVLYAPSYRERYFEFLRSDFPRLPSPGSAELFIELGMLGGSLVELHLLESPELDHALARVADPDHPEVKRVAWSEDTIWLDAPAPARGQEPRSGTIGFDGVAEEVWKFRIGGYQVCDKWLKDRKGRRLTKDEGRQYRRILVALAGTIRIMHEIDAAIAKHGSWPDAFDRRG